MASEKTVVVLCAPCATSPGTEEDGKCLYPKHQPASPVDRLIVHPVKERPFSGAVLPMRPYLIALRLLPERISGLSDEYRRHTPKRATSHCA